MFLVFYITHPDEATARSISESIVKQQLAACANVFPIQSTYWWEGAVQQEGEWVSILKTRMGLETELEKVIEALHPYEVPCVMRFEARANAAYEHWIEACCTPELHSREFPERDSPGTAFQGT